MIPLPGAFTAGKVILGILVVLAVIAAISYAVMVGGAVIVQQAMLPLVVVIGLAFAAGAIVFSLVSSNL